MPNDTGRTSTRGALMPVNFMRSVKLLIAFLVIALVAAPVTVRAALTIEIIGAGAKQIPIAIVQFRAEDTLSQAITPVIAADLARSGLFRAIDAGGVNPLPTEPAE